MIRNLLPILGIMLSVSGSLVAEPLAVISINNNNTLKWKLVTPSVGTPVVVTNSFGEVGDHIIFGNLTSDSAEQLGTIEESNNGSATWKVINQSGQQVTSLTFGDNTDIFVAGADVDNNGIIDPIIIQHSGSNLTWRSKVNGFAGGTTELSRNLGKSSAKGQLFYANLYGDGDWVGVVTKVKGTNQRKLQLRNLVTGQVRKVKIKKVGQKGEQPIPVEGPDGKDILAFARGNSFITKVVFVNSSGQKVATHSFDADGTFLKGDFDPAQSGEEFAVQDDNRILTFNPFSKVASSFSTPSGILVDRVNINDFEEDPDEGGGSSCSGGTPGICNCDFLDETDGYKIGFVYKRISDTVGGMVAILANPCGKEVTSLDTLDASTCNKIHGLHDHGYHNPDPTGLRRHFKELNGAYDGHWYQNNYGSIILRMNGTGKCYMLTNPSTERID